MVLIYWATWTLIVHEIQAANDFLTETQIQVNHSVPLNPSFLYSKLTSVFIICIVKVPDLAGPPLDSLHFSGSLPVSFHKGY